MKNHMKNLIGKMMTKKNNLKKKKTNMEKKKVSIGHLQKIHMNIEGMFKDFELDGVKEISLYVGQNGTGKTFLLIMQWILGTMGTAYLCSAKSMQEYEKILQLFFDKSFDDQKFTGKIGASYEYLEISFELDNGQVKDLDIILTDNTVEIEPEGMPVFMSKNTRLFSEIVKYLKFKKVLGMTGEITLYDDNKLNQLCDMWKLYDIMFIERMCHRLSDPNFQIKEKAKESFIETMKKEIVKVTYDEPNCSFVVHEIKDGKEITYSATQLSSGEQAWLNMFINV